MSTATRASTARPVEDIATPCAGSFAQVRIATDATGVLRWLRVLTADTGAAEVSAALDALDVLRTHLRSLRPILDKEWTVTTRDGLHAARETLAAVHRIDGEIRLLLESGADATALALVADLTAERAELTTSIGPSVGAGTRTQLTMLATGRRTAPLRTALPIGDAHLPAERVLPAMLHRRWRKLAKDTPADDLVAVHRRAAELMVITELAARAGVHVPTLGEAAGAVRTAAAAALRVESVEGIRARLPGCATRTRLAPVAKTRAWTARGVEEAMATVADLGRLLPDDGPRRVAGGGLVIRPAAAEPQVLLVHRVRHGDWSIPKGTAMPGEAAEACAEREVREETGLRCELGRSATGTCTRWS